MLYPKLVLSAGKDIKEIEQILKKFVINYKVREHYVVEEKTQIYIKDYDWPNKPFIYLDDILKGLNLPFFKSEPVELEWDVASCLPQTWTFDDWETNLFKDVNVWFLKNSNVLLTNNEKTFMSNIVNTCISIEIKILKLYTDILKPTFLHPHIQTLLNCCVRHKKAHVKMWYNVQKKLELIEQQIKCTEIKNLPNNMECTIDNLNEVIAREEILEPAVTKWLIYFTNKGHLGQFIKLVERRNKESKENAKLVEILLAQVEKMYPFLNYFIKYSYKCQQKYINYTNECLKTFQFVN